MLIESIIQRPGGTTVEMIGGVYHFQADASGRHVAEVDDALDAANLLSLTTGFRLVGGLEIAPGRHYRILAGLDSLTAGGGDPVSTYRDALADALKQRYGDGGPGLVWFDVLSPGYFVGATSGTAAGFLTGGNVNAPAWTSTARSHTLCGLGTVFTGVAGGYTGLDPAQPWDRARVYFELSAGASFGVVASGNGAIGETVDTTKFPTGALCCVDVYRAATHETALSIYSVAGTCTIFGADFLLDAGGVTLSNCAVSATTLAQHASLDDTWGRAWAAMLLPDVYILNGGMNDRTTDDNAKFGQGLNKLVGRWQSTGRTTVLLVRPPDSADANTTSLASYDRSLQATALARRCAYMDDRAALGSYAEAVAAGLMSDLVHPNAAGNQRRASALFAAINSLRG